MQSDHLLFVYLSCSNTSRYTSTKKANSFIFRVYFSILDPKSEKTALKNCTVQKLYI
jgi:hypothetical protein